MEGFQANTLTAEQLQGKLHAFERRYGMSSAEFYEQYQQGTLQLGPGLDDHDLVSWAGLCFMAAQMGILPKSALPTVAKPTQP